MIVAIKPKDIQKFGNSTIGEFNLANGVLTLHFNSSMFINGDYSLKIPEIEEVSGVKSVSINDEPGRIMLKVTPDELNSTLCDGEYNIPYTDWINTKNTF